MNPVFPEQNSNLAGERARLAGDHLYISRMIDRLPVHA